MTSTDKTVSKNGVAHAHGLSTTDKAVAALQATVADLQARIATLEAEVREMCDEITALEAKP